MKFKANPWGSFEPMKSETFKNSTTHELKPRPAFDMYSDEEEECELVEVPKEEQQPPVTNVQSEIRSPSPRHTFNHRPPSVSLQTPIPPFNVQYPVMQSLPTNKTTTYISSQQIDGPTMLDFQEVNNPAFLGLQDLSLYTMRQNEYNHFHYNDLPSYRQCINFRGSNRNGHY